MLATPAPTVTTGAIDEPAVRHAGQPVDPGHLARGEFFAQAQCAGRHPAGHLNASLYTCLQILSVSVFEKTETSCALQGDDPVIDPPTSANQLKLFDIQPDSSEFIKRLPQNR